MKKGIIICLLNLFCYSVFASCSGDTEKEGGEEAGYPSPVVETIRYEAENATLVGDAVVEKSMSGFSGTGYVNQNSGDISFRINVPEKGKYKLDIRYYTNGQKKENLLFINNIQQSSLIFDPAQDWETLPINGLILDKGENIVLIKKGWGWMFFDYIEVGKMQENISFNVSPSLVTPGASVQAVKLYNFLKDNFGKKTISGAMANYSTGLEEADWMHEKTGKWPALACFDFIDYNRTWDFVNYDAIVNNSEIWWQNNGIVSIMWHWRDPLKLTDQFYTEGTTFDVSKINDINSQEYKSMIADIDIIAGYLKQLNDLNIPVLWRPLHEAAGRWFWWGAKGAAPCKALWVLMYDRLTNHHGLNNLIWVWTSDAAGEASEWYPGDEYVDIIGMDIYPGERQHGSQYIAFNKVKELYGGRKIIALSECGSIPDIDKMFGYGDVWSWFMPWNGPMTRLDEHNGEEFINEVLNNDKVITRDKMPPLK